MTDVHRIHPMKIAEARRLLASIRYDEYPPSAEVVAAAVEAGIGLDKLKNAIAMDIVETAVEAGSLKRVGPGRLIEMEAFQ